jgi:hypothetical protein
VHVIELLHKTGAQVDLKDEIGGTPLYYAECKGHEKVVVELLVKKGTIAASKDVVSKRLVLSAAEKDREAVVKLLLGGKIIQALYITARHRCHELWRETVLRLHNYYLIKKQKQTTRMAL